MPGPRGLSERLSIRRRLLALLLPPLSLLTLLWAWTTYQSVLRFTDLAYDRALYDTARTLATQLKLQGGEAVLDLTEDERRMLEVDPQDSVYYEVVDASGQRLGGNKQLLAPDAGSKPSESGYFYNRVIDGEPLRLVQYEIKNESLENVIVRVAETRRKRTSLAREALVDMAPSMAAFIAVTILLVWWSVGRGFRPLMLMRDAISRRHHGDLSPLSSRGLPPELRDQVDVINLLMTRLAEVVDTERRFVADATHQLRTPIAVLRTQTELALRTLDSPSELQAHLRQMDAACQRLTRLANQVLNLSRAQASLDELGEVGLVDVTQVLEEIVAAHEPVAHAKAQKLEFLADVGPVWVRGSALMLGEMLANLVDNAIRYTPAGGRIAVDARVEGGKLRISVRDDGPGIPEAEMRLVLNRFYRGATSTGVGSGLGLAIVREVARAHGADFELLSAEADGSGLIASVALPISAA